MAQDTQSREPLRVAVVAVHGVADPKKDVSARTVADLLLERPDWRQAEEVLLTVEMVALQDSQGSHSTKDSRVDERSDRIRAALAQMAPGGRDPSLEFQEGMLEQYERSPDRTYRTPRITLNWVSGGPSRIAVDVLELYWADLSRAGKGVWRFFGELYQLLLHLPNLGRHALDAEAIRQGNPAWRRFAERQARLIRILTLGIVLLNLIMIPPAAAIASSAVPETWRGTLLALVGAGGGGAVVALWGLRGGWARGLPEIMVGLGGGAVAALGLASWRGPEDALALAAGLIAALAVLAVADGYRRVRPGAFRGASVGVAVVGLATLILATSGIEGGSVGRISVQLVITLFAGLRLLWFVLFIFGSIQFASGLLLSRGTRESAGGSLWTARFSLSLATWAFLVVTLSLWAVATHAVMPFLPTTRVDPWDMKIVFKGCTLWLLPEKLTRPDQSLPQLVKDLILATGGYTFTGALSLLLLFLAALAIGLAPAVRDEIRPPPRERPGDFEAQRSRTTTGLEVAFKSAELLSIGFAVAVLGSVLVSFGGWSSGAETLQWSASGFLFTLFIGRGGLGDARVVLDIVLDIDNYMRQRPRGACPRVRMFERVHALLNHFGTMSQAKPAAYDVVVFVAHSQGSAIVADYLRLAMVRGWLGVGDPRLHLMTMGCPLRQLYHRAFPALYEWSGSIGQRLAEFGLTSWINLYRSGDYIGRELPLSGSDGAARNVKVGVGAHTHYWDATTVQVGIELEGVIRGSMQSV
jgi:hypothetical protein